MIFDAFCAFAWILVMCFPAFAWPQQRLQSQHQKESTVGLIVDSVQNHRREVLRAGILLPTLVGSLPPLSPGKALAEEDQPPTPPTNNRRPRAPPEYLVPAIKVKNTVLRCIAIAQELNKKERIDLTSMNELQQLLLEPQHYTDTILEVPSRPAQQYLDSYNRKREDLSLLEKPGALLIQNGEIDTWKRLKRQEQYREKEDEIRAALNLYTSNLNFRSDSYVFTGSRELKSQLIRSDALPDVKSVITSDMGVRYLYRNAVLTNMEEAKAELRYLLKNEDVYPQNITELIDLLKQADTSLDDWFSLVDDNDINEASFLLRTQS